MQGFLTEVSNNLNVCIKLGIRILKVGEGLLVVTDRHGEQLPRGEPATRTSRGHPDNAAWRFVCFIGHA